MGSSNITTWKPLRHQSFQKHSRDFLSRSEAWEEWALWGLFHSRPEINLCHGLSSLFSVYLLMGLCKHREVIGTAESRLSYKILLAFPLFSLTCSPNYLLVPTERALIFIEKCGSAWQAKRIRPECLVCHIHAVHLICKQQSLIYSLKSFITEKLINSVA